jgi:hypothetical protein
LLIFWSTFFSSASVAVNTVAKLTTDNIVPGSKDQTRTMDQSFCTTRSVGILVVTNGFFLLWMALDFLLLQIEDPTYFKLYKRNLEKELGQCLVT